MTGFLDTYQGHDLLKIGKEYVEGALKVWFPHLDAEQISAFGGEIAYPSSECIFHFPLWYLLGKDSPYHVPYKRFLYFTDLEHLAEMLNSKALRLPNLAQLDGTKSIEQETQSYLENMYVLRCYGMDGKASPCWQVSGEGEAGIALELDIHVALQTDEYLFGAVHCRADFSAVAAEYAAKKAQLETSWGVTVNDCAVQALLSQYQKNTQLENDKEVRLIYLPREAVSPLDNRTLFYAVPHNIPVIYHRLPFASLQSGEYMPSVSLRNIHVSPASAFESVRETIEILLYANRASFDVAGIGILPAVR